MDLKMASNIYMTGVDQYCRVGAQKSDAPPLSDNLVTYALVHQYMGEVIRASLGSHRSRD